MALVDVVETGQERIHSLREEVEKARAALDRTDSVLAFNEDALERAEIVLTSGRRWGRLIALTAGALVVGAVVYAVIKRRRAAAEE